MVRLKWTFLGRVEYRLALELQYTHAKKVEAGHYPMLFLLEHPPTITLGRHADDSNILAPESEISADGFDVVRVLRGGDVTYHGPGQLVGYPVANISDARCNVPSWVEKNARAVIRFLSDCGLRSNWSDVHPGVWIGNSKIAAIGFHLSRGISTHGFAVNLDPDLSHFDRIIPCGLRDKKVTSVKEQLGRSPSLLESAKKVAHNLADELGWELEPMLEPGLVLGRSKDNVAEVETRV